MKFDLSYLQPKERASFGLRALYEAAGCRKYHMGRFEEYGLYQENRSFLSSEQVITFTDLDGRLLALKPDVTLSIAKTAQPAAGETLKYYYHENVYRPSAESHTFKEISQMGLEMLGAVGEAQVQQTVRLAAQSLGQMGAAWVLEVSHMGYLFGLLDALAVPENARPALLGSLREKKCPRAAGSGQGCRAGRCRGRDPVRAAEPLRRVRRDADAGRSLLQERPDAGSRCRAAGAGRTAGSGGRQHPAGSLAGG